MARSSAERAAGPSARSTARASPMRAERARSTARAPPCGVGRRRPAHRAPAARGSLIAPSPRAANARVSGAAAPCSRCSSTGSRPRDRATPLKRVRDRPPAAHRADRRRRAAPSAARRTPPSRTSAYIPSRTASTGGAFGMLEIVGAMPVERAGAHVRPHHRGDRVGAPACAPIRPSASAARPCTSGSAIGRAPRSARRPPRARRSARARTPPSAALRVGVGRQRADRAAHALGSAPTRPIASAARRRMRASSSSSSASRSAAAARGRRRAGGCPSTAAQIRWRRRGRRRGTTQQRGPLEPENPRHLLLEGAPSGRAGTAPADHGAHVRDHAPAQPHRQLTAKACASSAHARGHGRRRRASTVPQRRAVDALRHDGRRRCPGPSGTAMVPSAATSIAGSIRSGCVVARLLAAMSPGSEKFGRLARWMLCARPMPDLEHAAVPHRNAVLPRRDRAAGSTRAWPPTRPGLMLMIRQAPGAIASRAMRTVWIDSSRQIGVAICRCSSDMIASRRRSRAAARSSSARRRRAGPGARASASV